jgi:hypothetical protein
MVEAWEGKIKEATRRGRFGNASKLGPTFAEAAPRRFSNAESSFYEF